MGTTPWHSRLEQIALQTSLLAKIIPSNNFLDTLLGWPISKVMADAWGCNRHHLWCSREEAARSTLLHFSHRGITHSAMFTKLGPPGTRSPAASSSFHVATLFTFSSKSGATNSTVDGNEPDKINVQSKLEQPKCHCLSKGRGCSLLCNWFHFRMLLWKNSLQISSD